jgi:hypothetical protein
MLRGDIFVLLAAATLVAPGTAVAQSSAPGSVGLDRDGAIAPSTPSAPDALDVAPVAPVTIRMHQYTLEECLALADRNFPNLWAARARLAYAHAQLEEAKWLRWFSWSATSSFGVLPPLQGTVLFPSAPATSAG